MSLEEIRELFDQVFNKAKEKIGNEMATWHRVFQFVLDDGTQFYIELSGGEYRIGEGKHSSPVATLSTDRNTLLQILRGELDAMAAFMRGKLRITGNVLETAKLRQLIEASRG